MPLPPIPVKRGNVVIDGTPYPVRGMTRAEVARVKDLGDPVAQEQWILACGTDSEPDEVSTWYKEVSAGVVDLFIQRISELSGLGEGAQFRGGTDDSPRGT